MPAMQSIPEHYVTQFETNWKHLLQQTESRLKQYVMLDRVNGKEKRYNQLSPVSMQRITTRAGQTRITDQGSSQRWLRPFPYDIATIFDRWDAEFLGQVVLPTSETIKNQAMAYERTCDEVIIESLNGLAYTGELGVTPVSLPGSQEIAVNYVHPGGTPANSGLTLAKLIKAKSILGKNEVGKDEEMILAHTQQQLDDLLNNVNEIKSSDYNSVKALVNGDVDRFMGFKFVRLQLLPLVTSTDVRTAFAYVKSGVVLSDAGRQSHMDILPQQSHALQIRSETSLGATRLEEKKVVKIFCDESP
jgi:hypothetical protein